MKIIFWSDGFWPNIGGVEVLASSFIPVMQERGHEFCIITSHLGQGLPDQSTYRGSTLHRFHFHRALDSRNLKEIKIIADRIKEIKRAFGPDLIHINFSGISPFFHQLSRFPNEPPTVTTIHALPAALSSGQAPMMKQTLMNSRWVTAVSQAMLNEALLIAPQISPKSSVIYNGLKKPPLPGTELDFNNPRLLCLGRLSNEKGFDIALRALTQIVRRFPDVHLVVAGDGPERGELETLASLLGLGSHVSFVGWVPPEKRYELINQSCLLIVPSRWKEPFCLVALEGALMGRPVVASRTGALPEVVVENETGIFFENENPASLADAVISLLESPSLATAMGLRGRERANRKFTWDRYIDSFEMLFTQLAHERRNVPD